MDYFAELWNRKNYIYTVAYLIYNSYQDLINFWQFYNLSFTL